MKLLATYRDGNTTELEIVEPFTIRSHEGEPIEKLPFWVISDARGTDFYFRRDDGTYDGWGRAVSSNAEAEKVLQHARTSDDAPKEKIQ